MKVLSRRRIPGAAVIPVAWFLFFLFVPLGFILLYSVLERGLYGGIVYRFSWENYLRAADWLYIRIFLVSGVFALLTAFSCVLVAYPIAYTIATSRRSLRPLLLGLVVVPFWTSFVIRVYAIKVLLADAGPLNAFLQGMGFVSAPLGISSGLFAVGFGMLVNYLPFAVFPLYVALEKFDFSLLEAARDLGASGFQVVTRILVPLSRRAIVTAFILVFTPTLGEFIIPDLLGGARVMLIGNLITDQFIKTRDWPFGAALSILLILIVLGSLAIYLRNSARTEAKYVSS